MRTELREQTCPIGAPYSCSASYELFGCAEGSSDRPISSRVYLTAMLDEPILMERRGRTCRPSVVDLTFLQIYNSIEPLAPPPVVSAREGFIPQSPRRSRRSDYGVLEDPEEKNSTR